MHSVKLCYVCMFFCFLFFLADEVFVFVITSRKSDYVNVKTELQFNRCMQNEKRFFFMMRLTIIIE